MRRLLAWIGGTAVGIAVYRLLRRPRQAAAEPATAEPDARADELRAKLAETREAEPEEPESPEERRRRVHEEGRAAVDEMKSDSP